jgi:hypothetical protein
MKANQKGDFSMNLDNIEYMSTSSGQTLTAKSFIFLWQTSCDLEEFEEHIDFLRESNPRLRVAFGALLNRREKYVHKRGIPLQRLEWTMRTSNDWDELADYADSFNKF